MPVHCTLKVLAAQLFVALVAACALLGIKFSTASSYTLQVERADIKAPFPVLVATDGASGTVDLQSRGLSVNEGSQADVFTPVIAKVAPLEVPYQHKHSVYKRAHKYGDLPALRNDRSPDNDQWDNGIAICACMFGENTTDIREWILYNRWLGVDHIYLTENGPAPAESFMAELQEFIDDGFITFRNDPKPSFQQTIYVDCMTQHRHKHNWMAFIDLDEFIVLRNKDVALKDFLDDYKHQPALVMHWVIVGPSHQESRPQEGGVLRAYRECQTRPSPVVKSIVNTFMLANMASNPHTYEYSITDAMLFRNNEPSVDEHKRPMPWRYPIPPQCLDGTIKDPQKNLDCRPVPHVQKRPESVDSIALFHYITRSKEDFERKVERGGGGGKHRTWEHFNRIQLDASSTGGICDEAYRAADDCCKPGSLSSATQQTPPSKKSPRSNKHSKRILSTQDSSSS